MQSYEYNQKFEGVIIKKRLISDVKIIIEKEYFPIKIVIFVFSVIYYGKKRKHKDDMLRFGSFQLFV